MKTNKSVLRIILFGLTDKRVDIRANCQNAKPISVAIVASVVCMDSGRRISHVVSIKTVVGVYSKDSDVYVHN